MIDPNDIHQLVQDQIDGLLDPAAERELMAWLETHPNDARTHRRLLRTRELIRLKRYEGPGTAYYEGFVDRFHQRLLSRDIVERRTRVIDATRWFAAARNPMALGAAAMLALLFGIGSLIVARQFQGARAQAVAGAGERRSDPPDALRPAGAGPIDPLLVATTDPLLAPATRPLPGAGTGWATPRAAAIGGGPNLIDPVLDLERLRADYDAWFDRVRAAERQSQAPTSDRRYPVRQIRPPVENAGYGF